MSQELKDRWFWAYGPYLDAPEKQAESAVHAGYVKVVYKSEVDAVLAKLEEQESEIAELENKLDIYKRGWKENDKVNAYLYAELRHHKHKWCLWLARWCASRSASWLLDPANDELHKSDFYDKWHKRRLELATKFKEVK